MWELDCEESWVLKNWCFWTMVLEKTLESPLDCKEIQPVHSKGDQSWVFFGRTDAKAETPIHLMQRVDSLKRLWCWEGLGAGGEGDDKGSDGWMASLTPRTRVWVNSGSWWWTGRPGMLWFMGSQRVRHNWVTELNWYKKDLHEPENYNGVITHLEPDILECEVKWALGSITKNKERKIKSIKLEMKVERSQQTTQKYKGS